MKYNISVYNRFHFFILICALLDIIPKSTYKSTVFGTVCQHIVPLRLFEGQPQHNQQTGICFKTNIHENNMN